MRILVEVGHPAHVHYFRNFIKIMEARGHSFLVIAREKEMTLNLLDYYDIKYKSRGKGKDSVPGKFFYLPYGILYTALQAIKFKPDIFISMGSPFAAIASKFVNKPHITFDDTENAILTQFLYKPFTDVILSPSAYRKVINNRHIKFNGFMELCYLHPNNYTPDPSIRNILHSEEEKRYCLVRFVKWKAHHDINHKGITPENKIKLIKEFSKYAEVFISSEGELPPSLKQYQINIPYEKIHDVIKYASLVFGDSATMTSEAAILGTPSIYIGNVDLGNMVEEQDKYELVFNYTENASDQVAAIKKGLELLTTVNIKEEWRKRKERMFNDKIDVTAFIIWFIENYPSSFQTMKENPGYQNNFK